MNEYRTNIKSLDKQPNLVKEKYAKLLQMADKAAEHSDFHEFLVLGSAASTVLPLDFAVYHPMFRAGVSGSPYPDK